MNGGGDCTGQNEGGDDPWLVNVGVLGVFLGYQAMTRPHDGDAEQADGDHQERRCLENGNVAMVLPGTVIEPSWGKEEQGEHDCRQRSDE